MSARNTIVCRLLWDAPRIPSLVKAIYEEDIRRVQTLLVVLPPILINVKDYLGRTPLHAAIDVGNPQILHQILLKNIINIEARDFEDCTVLHRAIEKHCLKLVQVLLYHGADVNACCRKFSGQTPFLFCLSNKCERISIQLLDYVVDFNEKDNSGNSTLYFALKNESELIEEIIKRRGKARTNSSEMLQSLYYKDNSIFEYCSKRTDYTTIIVRMLFVLLSHDCKFVNGEWLSTMNHILKSLENSQQLTQSNVLCDQCSTYVMQHMFRCLLQTFSRRDIQKQYRYQLVYGFLSYGAPLYSLETHSFHSYYIFADKQKMLHILVQAGFNVDNYLQNINNNTNPLTVRLYLNYSKLRPNYILGKILLTRMNMSHIQLSVINILSNLCTPNERNKRLYKMYREELGYKTVQMRNENVPKLLELSRDEVRTLIGEKYKTSCFCCILKHINLPQEVKDLLLLVRSLPQ